MRARVTACLVQCHLRWVLPALPSDSKRTGLHFAEMQHALMRSCFELGRRWARAKKNSPASLGVGLAEGG